MVGVSRDDVVAQRKFAEGQGLPYPLVPDVDGTLGKALGVPSTAGFYSRVTVLVAPNGRVGAVIKDVDVKRHAEQVAAVIAAGK